MTLEESRRKLREKEEALSALLTISRGQEYGSRVTRDDIMRAKQNYYNALASYNAASRYEEFKSDMMNALQGQL